MDDIVCFARAKVVVGGVALIYRFVWTEWSMHVLARKAALRGWLCWICCAPRYGWVCLDPPALA
jgi:hypothetical protein